MKYVLLLLGFVFFITCSLNAQVKINEVLYSTSTEQIELKNFGTSAVDVSDWWFCARLIYRQIGNLNIESGSFNIPAGGILVVSIENYLNNSSSDLGLYLPIESTADFADDSFMEDFVQWGQGGHGRESVAVSKGIWTAGDFVPTVESGHSIEYDGDGNASTDWFDQENPTLGSENDVATSIEANEGEVPNDFKLEQNFPNPFNPSTTIAYRVPQTAKVTPVRLEIFNTMGQKVRTLVNATLTAGSYSAVWNGKDDAGTSVASGVYVYRLQAGEFSTMKKMLLMQ